MRHFLLRAIVLLYLKINFAKHVSRLDLMMFERNNFIIVYYISSLLHEFNVIIIHVPTLASY